MIFSGILKKEASTSRKSSASSKARLLASFGRVCPWPPVTGGVDYLLLSLVACAMVFGIIMVYSSSFIFAYERAGDGFLFVKKQLMFAGLGVLVFLIVHRINYRVWYSFAYPAIMIGTLLLLMVMIPGLGEKAGGAQRWLNLGGIRFQPVEVLKFATVLFVARQLDLKSDRIHKFGAGILGNLLVLLPALVLLLLQPDFGSAVIVVAVIAGITFMAGVPLKHLLATLATLAVAGGALVMTSPYRLARLSSFLDPWKDPSGSGFQVLQSLVGIHRGGLTGTGLGNGKEKLFYLPEAHNDFIMAVIGEELGFVGVAAVTLLFVVIVIKGLRIGWQAFEKFGDKFGLLLASGITLVIGFQAMVNIGVVMGILPTKGLNLPFVSYGGSALLMNCFAIAVLVSISRGPKNVSAPAAHA